MQELTAIILIAYLFKISSCESIVETNSGFVESVAAQLDDVEAFLGIPYAEPPIGDLRFAKPVPKQPWTEIYEASSLPPPCLQYSAYLDYAFYPNTSNMSEDCLYLNIWKPKSKPNGFLRPVIIYIHYGGFVTGSSNQKELDGSHLASKGDMVVVTINYRLGSFGFFLANIEEADGNMGMYDQIMAIRWVKDNVQYFEGDPDNIILMGTSAGGISISAIIVSPLSQNLFRRAIILSGAILNPIWMDGNDFLFKNSEIFASKAGCTNETVSLTSDPRSVVECLKEKPADILLKAQTSNTFTTRTYPFHPRVGDQFMPKDAASVYREGKFSRNIDVMFGSDKDEGTLLMLLAGMSNYVGKYGDIPITLTRNLATGILRQVSSAVKIKNPLEKINYYFDRVKNKSSEGYLKAMSDIVGDFIISCSLVFSADFLSLKGNRVYFYKFGLRTEATPFSDWLGTVHGEDVQFAFGKPYYGNFTAEEVDQSDRFIARLSAFAYTGDPNVPGQLPWLQYSYNNPLYLFICQDGESLRLKPWDRCEVWRKEFNAEIDLNEAPSGDLSRSGTQLANEADSFLQIIRDFFTAT